MTNSQKGKFIVFEGGEGTGKTSLIMSLRKILTQKGHDVIFTREPGGTPSAEKIRDLLLSSKTEGDDPDVLTQIFLFEASRADHIRKVIVPGVKSGKVILCDRFSPSTYAYQIAGEEREYLENTFWALDNIARTTDDKVVVSPDLLFLLTGDSKKCLERAKGRNEDLTRFDARAVAFHERVAAGYKKSAQVFNARYLNAENSQAEVLEEALRILREELGL